MRKVLTRVTHLWQIQHAAIAIKKRHVSERTKKMQRKLKVATGKHVTIAQLARDINRSPRECRAALRTLNVPKPMHGWAWAPSEAAVIKSRLLKKFSGKSKPKNSEGASRDHPARIRPNDVQTTHTSASAENIALDAPGNRLDAA